ncbi:Nif3-like dinuclear metal center hexameric protein [Acidicapsa ligni]|uniref:Nif3-like dinuclear metal center hexameric protein n=1 Tax=Acidicapsa ligni TaxID=542300 RepID=UPI0021DFC7B6|nr:Nif3-like dinuclear metal center hexameric protein [Acidicapsa ligni]
MGLPGVELEGIKLEDRGDLLLWAMSRFMFPSVACYFASTVVLFVVSASVAGAQSAPAPLTAGQAIEQIVQATGATRPANTVDTIKEGDPATVVTGIATTFTPSMDVLRRAVAAGDNLIVTHEPTFYNHLDERTLFVDDPVYKEKLAYINEHHLVIWRFHDTWHMRQPDGIAEGFVDQAGWKKYENPGPASEEGFFFTLPPTTLQALAADLQKRFHARSVRIIGDPNLKITKVAYRAGASGEAKQVKALERDDVEVLVAGEASEWETVEYTRDAQLQGRKKALILLGHLTSEESGMDYCAKWLKPIFPGLPIQYLPAGEPYWTPQRLPVQSKH